jgi:uncharacterized protein (DUF1697 family)
MPRQVILLRGVNLGAANRLSMAALREALAAEGFADVETYKQSGNILASHAASPAGLAAQIKQLLAERFDVSVPVLVLTCDQLAKAVRENPFADLADASAVEELRSFAAEADDEFAASGLAVYSWHPGGIHLSKLATKMTEKRLGVDVATARNWTTVTTLLEMAGA